MNRVFRADTPHDAVCAAIVAETLPPGRDVLALSADKTTAEPGPYLESMISISSIHRWSSVVDVSGLPMLRQPPAHAGLTSALTRIRGAVRSMPFLRRALARAFELDAESRHLTTELASRVDEVYLTCFHHPDMQAMYTVFPRSRKAYLPHGFGSLHRAEIEHYARFCAPGATNALPPDGWKDLVKRWTWGPDAVPVRRMLVDTAYSFHLPAPWAREQHSLAHWLDPRSMRSLFDTLPEPVQKYYRGQAEQCGSDAGLLLLTPSYQSPSYPYELETEGLVGLARTLRDREGVRCLLVKPHPLTSDQRLESVLARLHDAVPDLTIVVIEDFREFPIEVVLSPFTVKAGGGIWSSSIRTLRMIYGTRFYCPEDLLLRLEDNPPNRIWIEEHRGDYIAV